MSLAGTNTNAKGALAMTIITMFYTGNAKKAALEVVNA
jgi:hypothetical protein